MYKNRSVGVIIPAFNVERHIATVVSQIPTFVDHVIIVNDGSQDETGRILSALSDRRVSVLTHATNRGVGAAMVTGYQKGLDLEDQILVKVDGDDQMDLNEMPRLLDAIIDQGYAYAKGNRFLHKKELNSMPSARLFGNFMLTFLNKLVSGYWHIFDPQNGYLAISREALSLLPLERLASGYFFENDMLVHLNIFSLPVKDVPIPARYGTENSSVRIGRIVAIFPTLFFRRYFYRLYQRYVLRDFSPIVIFLLAGGLMMLWGSLFGAYRWYLSVTTSRAATTGTVMLALLPFLIGFELVLQALLLDINSSPS